MDGPPVRSKWFDMNYRRCWKGDKSLVVWRVRSPSLNRLDSLYRESVKQNIYLRYIYGYPTSINFSNSRNLQQNSSKSHSSFRRYKIAYTMVLKLDWSGKTILWTVSLTFLLLLITYCNLECSTFFMVFNIKSSMISKHLRDKKVN